MHSGLAAAITVDWAIEAEARWRNGLADPRNFTASQIALLKLSQEVERLRDELHLCCELKRQYQEQAAAERVRCADLCDQLAEAAHKEMLMQPANSAARDRYIARRDALRSAAVEMRLGPNAVNEAPTTAPPA
jgi:hypothetical protein